MKKASLMVPLPDTFVKSVLGRLGVETQTMGYWVHDRLLCALSQLLPGSMGKKFTYNSRLGIRKHELKKLQRKAD